VCHTGLRTAKKLRNVPGTPLVLISKNVIVLEQPSGATEAKAAELESKKMLAGAFEKKVLKKRDWTLSL